MDMTKVYSLEAAGGWGWKKGEYKKDVLMEAGGVLGKEGGSDEGVLNGA